MTPDEFFVLDDDEMTDDALELRAAVIDNRATIKTGDNPNNVWAYWYASPQSSAPGGPWYLETVMQE